MTPPNRRALAGKTLAVALEELPAIIVAQGTPFKGGPTARTVMVPSPIGSPRVDGPLPATIRVPTVFPLPMKRQPAKPITPLRRIAGRSPTDAFTAPTSDRPPRVTSGVPITPPGRVLRVTLLTASCFIVMVGSKA